MGAKKRYLKVFNLWMTDKTWERLQAESEKLGISIAEIIRRAIEQYFKESK